VDFVFQHALLWSYYNWTITSTVSKYIFRLWITWTWTVSFCYYWIEVYILLFWAFNGIVVTDKINKSLANAKIANHDKARWKFRKGLPSLRLLKLVLCICAAHVVSLLKFLLDIGAAQLLVFNNTFGILKFFGLCTLEKNVVNYWTEAQSASLQPVSYSRHNSHHGQLMDLLYWTVFRVERV